MTLDGNSMFIVDFLPETDRILARIDFFEISSGPTPASRYFIPVTASTIGKLFPRAKCLLIDSSPSLIYRRRRRSEVNQGRWGAKPQPAAHCRRSSHSSWQAAQRRWGEPAGGWKGDLFTAADAAAVRPSLVVLSGYPDRLEELQPRGTIARCLLNQTFQHR